MLQGTMHRNAYAHYAIDLCSQMQGKEKRFLKSSAAPGDSIPGAEVALDRDHVRFTRSQQPFSPASEQIPNGIHLEEKILYGKWI